MYSLIRKLLFRLEPEKAHSLTLKLLRLAYKLNLLKHTTKQYSPREVMGLLFENPVGLAAGLDKNGDYIEALGALGFGFIEIGTVTPKPQEGNLLPRLFRLPEQQAIINRMGFNNKGLDYVATRLRESRYSGVLGVNIGKNRDTPLENAHEDYLLGFRRVAHFASYVTINISSPNTSGLRDLQQADLLKVLLQTLKQEQALFAELSKKYVPLVVKIAPDLASDDINLIADVFLEQKIDGVIATNTTISREGVESSAFASEAGGLSGKPLAQLATNTIAQLNAVLKNQIPIIGCGGIFSEKDARDKLAAGASLIQIYTSLIYEGPGLIGKLVEACRD
ncbi:MAG: quinone-dependent dihydroorotate dehydrogenase [Gammaproteobacteria bacterium]